MYRGSNSSPLLVVVGETASGKSALALDLAQRLNGEVIAADSWTVRRELNIGTDKPTKRERELVTHHLVDIIDPCSDFTAAVFKELANKAILDITSRHKLPILVGGSGLYIDSVIFNYKFLSPGEPSLRKDLNLLSIDDLLKKITDLKLSLSPDIDKRNKRRLIRVIESGGIQPTKGNLRPNTLVVGLKLNSDQLKLAIESRVDKMIKAGLEAEVESLSTRYGWECEALKGVGYKQWRNYLEGTKTLEETMMQIISATNNLAKKQRTWFKRNKSIHWFLQPIKIDEIVDLATTKLSI